MENAHSGAEGDKCVSQLCPSKHEKIRIVTVSHYSLYFIFPSTRNEESSNFSSTLSASPNHKNEPRECLQARNTHLEPVNTTRPPCALWSETQVSPGETLRRNCIHKTSLHWYISSKQFCSPSYRLPAIQDLHTRLLNLQMQSLAVAKCCFQSQHFTFSHWPLCKLFWCPVSFGLFCFGPSWS